METQLTYEYLTKWFPERTHVPFSEDKDIVSPGFERIFSDTTTAGTLILYRKAVEKKDLTFFKE